MALVRWGEHVVEIIGFDAPMPAQALEPCLQLSHYGAELKQQAREHTRHLLLWEVTDADPLARHVALAAVGGALAPWSPLVVVNETAQTTMPAAVFQRSGDAMLEMLSHMPLPMLYCGFAKYEVEGTAGVWMRTWGAHTLGLPNLAHLAAGHHEGQQTHDLFENVMRYLLSSGAELGPGHTMQVG